MGRGQITSRAPLSLEAEPVADSVIEVRGPLIIVHLPDRLPALLWRLPRLGADAHVLDLGSRRGQGHGPVLRLTQRLGKYAVSVLGARSGEEISPALAQSVSTIDHVQAFLTNEGPARLGQLERALSEQPPTLEVRVSEETSRAELVWGVLRGSALQTEPLRWLVRLPSLGNFMCAGSHANADCMETPRIAAAACPHATVTRALAPLKTHSLEERLLEGDDTVLGQASFELEGRPKRGYLKFTLEGEARGITLEVDVTAGTVRMQQQQGKRWSNLASHTLTTDGRGCLSCITRDSSVWCSIARVRSKHGDVPLLQALRAQLET